MFLKFFSGMVLMFLALTVSAATPQDLLKTYEAQSGKASPARGEQFFNAKHGKEWSCASCHEIPLITTLNILLLESLLSRWHLALIQHALLMKPKQRNGLSAIATM